MEALQQMAAVAAVLALLAGAVWWLRRRGLASLAFPARRPGGVLESMGRLALGPQHVLHLVRYRDRVLLLATSPGGCSLLDRAPAPGVEHPGLSEVGR